MQLSKIVFSLAAVSVPILAQPADEVVWQIGKFDQSPLEFSGRGSGPVQFEVGKSNWKTDWQARQRINNPYNIVFALPPPTGTYTLKITALIEQPRIPTLQVSINGHRGTFFLRPRLSYYPGDGSFAGDPHQSESTLDIRVPSAFLIAGTNTVTLVCVDDPPSRREKKSFPGLFMMHSVSVMGPRGWPQWI
jgi:alpha-mannosidase